MFSQAKVVDLHDLTSCATAIAASVVGVAVVALVVIGHRSFDTSKVINDTFGLEEGLMTTVHAVTATQKKDRRRPVQEGLKGG